MSNVFSQSQVNVNSIFDTIGAGIKKVDFPDDERLTIASKLLTVCNHIKAEFIARGYDIAVFVDTGGILRIYDGKSWVEISDETAEMEFAKLAERAGAGFTYANTQKGQREILEQMKVTARVRAQFPTEIMLNVSNGTLRIDTAGNVKMKPHKAGDYLTYCLPYEYNPEATCPKWNAFLNDVLPVTGLQELLQLFVGSIFIPPSVMKVQKALVLKGQGGNGKGVLTEIIGAVLGSGNISNVLEASLYHENSRRALIGKLANISSESFTTYIKDQGLLRALIAQESVEFKILYKDSFASTNYGRLIFCTNDSPKGIDFNSGANSRRWIAIPFEKTFIANPDKKLAARIIANELPGILNWVIEGLRKFCKVDGDFPTVKESLAAMQEMKLSSNAAAAFLDFKGIVLPSPENTRKVTLSDLFRDFEVWTTQNGHSKITSAQFGKCLADSGFKSVRKRFAGHLERVYSVGNDLSENV